MLKESIQMKGRRIEYLDTMVEINSDEATVASGYQTQAQDVCKIHSDIAGLIRIASLQGKKIKAAYSNRELVI